MRRRTEHPSHTLRLVVESDDPTLAVADFVRFTSAGFDVTVCGGPDDTEPCPALRAEVCPLVEDADVVMNAMRDPELQRAVADGIRATSPNVALVVRAPDDVTSVNGQLARIRRAIHSTPREASRRCLMPYA